MATIGENIRRIRKQKGLTQKQLAELCNPPMIDSAIRRYESNKANPKIETSKRIAAALGCEVTDIDESIIVHRHTLKLEFTPENIERYKKDAETRELIRKLESGEQITEEEKEKVSGYVKRIHDSFSQLPERTKDIKDKIDTIGENILLADYRELNTKGQSEARKRVNELTEIPRYTKRAESPQE